MKASRIKQCLICTPEKRPGGGGVYFWDKEGLRVSVGLRLSGWEVHCQGIHEHTAPSKKEQENVSN